MTTAPPPPRRIVNLVPGFEELFTASALLVRDAFGGEPEQFLITYERATGSIGDGADPRGPEDPIRFVAALGNRHKLRGHRARLSWRIGVSPDVAYGADPADLLEAATDAVAALVKDLTGTDAGVAALRP